MVLEVAGLNHCLERRGLENFLFIKLVSFCEFQLLCSRRNHEGRAYRTVSNIP